MNSAAAQPGYVRLVLSEHDPRNVPAACLRFAQLCREESATRGMIVAISPAEGGGLQEDLDAAVACAGAGFRLAVVARGAGCTAIARSAAAAAARRRAAAKTFKSEHQAAAWLMA